MTSVVYVRSEQEESKLIIDKVKEFPHLEAVSGIFLVVAALLSALFSYPILRVFSKNNIRIT